MKFSRRMRLAALFAALMMTAACSSAADDSPADSAPSTSSAGESSSGESQAQSNEKNTALGEFSVTDLEGAAVDQTIFAGRNLTMVNIWGTFCGPCIDEMPDLGQLNAEYADQGFQIVGIVVDTLDQNGNPVQSQLDTAKEIVEKTGAAYTHLIPNIDLMRKPKMTESPYIPTTFFVDGSGNTVGKLYSGKKSKKEYSKIIEQLLAEVQQ